MLKFHLLNLFSNMRICKLFKSPFIKSYIILNKFYLRFYNSKPDGSIPSALHASLVLGLSGLIFKIIYYYGTLNASILISRGSFDYSI